jgi:hypothetical protein
MLAHCAYSDSQLAPDLLRPVEEVVIIERGHERARPRLVQLEHALQVGGVVAGAAERALGRGDLVQHCQARLGAQHVLVHLGLHTARLLGRLGGWCVCGHRVTVGRIHPLGLGLARIVAGVARNALARLGLLLVPGRTPRGNIFAAEPALVCVREGLHRNAVLRMRRRLAAGPARPGSRRDGLLEGARRRTRARARVSLGRAGAWRGTGPPHLLDARHLAWRWPSRPFLPSGCFEKGARSRDGEHTQPEGSAVPGLVMARGWRT